MRVDDNPFFRAMMIIVLSALGHGLIGPAHAQDSDGVAAENSGKVMLFPIVKENKWGYMDLKGKVVIEPQYKLAFDFYEGMACVGLKAFRGFIDETGKMIVKPTFGWASKYSEGLARVNLHRGLYGEHVAWYKATTGWGFIDKSGKIIFKTRYSDKPGNFSSGVVWTNQGKYRGKAGEKLVAFEGDEGSSFSEGRAGARKGKLWGYIDSTLKFVIEPTFGAVRPFSEGLAPVATAIAPPNKKDVHKYRAWQKGPRYTWGFIDKTGKLVIEHKFFDVWLFTEGLAPVWIEGKWGYINKSGEVVIKPTYDYVWPFKEGKGRVLVGEKSGYINKEGKLVIEAKFDSAWEYSKGLARVGVGDKEGYIGHDGKFVWEPTE